MKEFIFEKIKLQMKLTQIVKTWRPYLEEKNANDFLQILNLKQEYMEMKVPQIYNILFDDCKTKLLATAGALICICVKCQYQNIFKKQCFAIIAVQKKICQ
jgi:hypothetical protein